jgi:hypothetical protein
MTDTSRRHLLAAAGAGAAAGAVTVVAGAAQAAPAGTAAREEVVAHVKDHRSSTLVLMVGEREVVVHDRDLVTRILNAAGGN